MIRGLTLLAAAFVAGCSPGVVASSPAPVPILPPPSAPAPAAAPISVHASASVVDVAGTRIGTVSFSDTPGGLLVIGTVTGLGLGPHGIHLHAIGVCEAPFTSAGGHFNPSGLKHGYRNPAGHHAGDMPNIVTPAAGTLTFQFIVDGLRLTGRGGLLDADGASVVIHSSGDDYLTDPAGNSGGRLACGVITLSK